MKRIDTPELLDEHDAPRAEMERSLRDLRRINRWLGGAAIYRRLLRRFSSRKLTILDLGAGSADLLESVGGGIGLDFKIEHLRYASGTCVKRVVGDAKRLPFRDGTVDVVTSSHFFHHFSEEENAGILADALRVSRAGVVINDTRRHYVPLAVVVLLGLLRIVGSITRFDAPASVRRGYTTAEAREIAARAGARKFVVVNAWPFRFGILLWK